MIESTWHPQGGRITHENAKALAEVKRRMERRRYEEQRAKELKRTIIETLASIAVLLATIALMIWGLSK
jgi:hypothetical protein